jgi:plasmid stabilization system protein ParE
VGAVTVGERLHLSFRYRHRLFGADAARAFADRYLAELDRLIDPAPPTAALAS